MKKRILSFTAFIALMVLHQAMRAQDSIPVKEKKWAANGYLKDLVIVSHSGGADSVQFDNLVHNRINLRWFPSASFSAGASIRTRFFWGDGVRNNPLFDEALDKDSGFVDLSFVPLKGKSYALHTTLDRLWLRWQHKKWEMTAGRQRINWGMNLVWNPNDLFNTYSYIDFDYEERPGSDALLIQRYTGNLSVAEIALKPGKKFDQSVFAGMYKFNKKNYDIQILGGMFKTDWVLGTGWAGNLKNWGFKGEISAFLNRKNFSDSAFVFASSLSLDRTFKKLYLNFSGLFNSAGTDRLTGVTSLPGFALSPKQLSPFRFTFFAQASYPVLPILRADIGIMLAPVDQTVFLMPSLAWSVKNNFDLLLVSQMFFSDVGTGYRPLSQTFFLRGKWSF